MKKVLFKSLSSALILCLLLGGNACKNNDNDPSPGGVEGRWKISAITVSPAVLGITDFLAYLIALTGDDCIKRVTLNFNSNGKVSGTVPQDCDAEGTGEYVSDGSSWKVEGKKIILTDTDGEVSTYDLEVSGSEMKWSYEEADDEDPSKKYKYTIVLRK